MPRLSTARLDKASRKKLRKRPEPYFKTVDADGIAGVPYGFLGLGYRAGPGTFIARWYRPGYQRQFKPLGVADDKWPADGVRVLTTTQAELKARAWLRALYKPQADQEKQALAQLAEGDEAEAEGRATIIWQAPLTVSRAMDLYLAYLRNEHKPDGPAKSAVERHIKPALGKRHVAELTTAEIEKWRLSLIAGADENSLPSRKASANRVMTTLFAGLQRAYLGKDGDFGIPNDKAWKAVNRFRNAGAPREEALTAEQVQRLVNATNGPFRDLVIALWFTGARPPSGELAYCRVRDLRTDLHQLMVRQSKTKKRGVVLSTKAETWFKALAAGKHPDALLFPNEEGGQWQSTETKYIMADAAKRAGLSADVVLYSLRHSFATREILAGTNLAILAKSMGTSIVQLHRTYGHVIDAASQQHFDKSVWELSIPDRNVTALQQHVDI